ncbi:MAG: hypothetical protein Q4A56_01910 [Porphyromonadaceae bacterium]|nr:hypothetical protein [Porphyromonadaceae bacterium]
MNKKVLVTVGIIAIVILAGLIGFLAYQLNSAKKERDEILEQFSYEKEQMEQNKTQLEQDYVTLSNDLEGFSLQVNNDSILKKLNNEQKRVQLLLEELRTTKATNVKRINELKNELSTVRKVLTYYIAQVDSLNKANTQLKTENVEVNRKFQEASRRVDTLSLRNENLTEKVMRAAQLEARNIAVELQTKNGKKTTRLSRADVVKISFTISKNITANVGEKTVYIRIVNPNKDVLFTKSSDTFFYENKNIVYSAKKNFEYSGIETSQSVYWTVNETLIKGSYRVDIFVDSHLIGSADFSLPK